MSREQQAGQNQNIKIGNKSFEEAVQSRLFGSNPNK
jgi:hypothetical protein